MPLSDNLFLDKIIVVKYGICDIIRIARQILIVTYIVCVFFCHFGKNTDALFCILVSYVRFVWRHEELCIFRASASAGAFLNLRRGIGKMVNDTFVFRENRALVRLLFCDIVFFESSGHYIMIHTNDGAVYRMRGTVEEVRDMLDESFVKVHRGIIVNMKYVKEVCRHEVRLNSIWEGVPVSRSYKEELEEAFDAFRA